MTDVKLWKRSHQKAHGTVPADWTDMSAEIEGEDTTHGEDLAKDVLRLRPTTHAPSGVTSKPANGGHRKSGQWGWPGTVLFYPFEPVPGKPVLVRQLRGPHLRT